MPEPLVSNIDLSKDIQSEIREQIRTGMSDSSVPSLTLSVAQGDRIIWEEAFGWADLESRTPATPKTPYSLASITKPITATGLMILVERGLIHLDRPTNDYLGDSKLKARIGYAEDATVRRLANHTCGLPTHYHFFFEDEPYTPPPMDETIRRYGHLVNPPGETYRYANMGFGILDHIITLVSDKPYAQFIREEVFEPLGMNRSSIGSPQALPRHHATRYTEDCSPIPFYDFDHPGASAAFCSAHDLIRFGMFHLNAHLSDQKPILSDATIDQMQVPTAEIDSRKGYGIGWFVQQGPGGHRIVKHGGNMGGVRTCLYLVPDLSVAVTVLINANNELPIRIADEILSALLSDYPQQASISSRSDANLDPPPDLLGTWKGTIETYSGSIPLTLDIRSEGGIQSVVGTHIRADVTDLTFSAETLTGSMPGDIGTDDAAKLPYKLDLNLKHRGQFLNGSVTAISLPHPRFGNALSHWVELARQP
jgi:CubicO group peptidase (beta-lactamase class C family)